MRGCKGMCVRGRERRRTVTNVSWTDASVRRVAREVTRNLQTPDRSEWNMQHEEERKQSTGGDQFQSGMANCKNCTDIAH